MKLSQAKENRPAVIATIIKMIATDYNRAQEAKQAQASYDVTENNLTTTPEHWLVAHSAIVIGEQCAAEIEWLLGDIDSDEDYEDAAEYELRKRGMIKADDSDYIEQMDNWCGMVGRVQSYIKTIETFSN